MRQFESPAPEFSQLVTHSDNSSAAYYTVSGLAPAAPYTVCLEPVILEAETEARGRQCREFSTLASSLSTVTQVSTDNNLNIYEANLSFCRLRRPRQYPARARRSWWRWSAAAASGGGGRRTRRRGAHPAPDTWMSMTMTRVNRTRGT